MDKLGVGNLLFLLIFQVVQGRRCMYPGHGLHMSTNMTLHTVDYGTTVIYKCDSGFEMFGNQMRKCQIDRTWTGEEPICVMDVARHKKVMHASPYVDIHDGEEGWEKIVDGFYKTCSLAANADMVPSSWSIDLLHEYEIAFVKVAFGEAIKGLIFDILEGNSSDSRKKLPIVEDSFKNVHSVFMDFEYDDSKEMSEYILKFKIPITTRFLTVQIPTQYQLRSRITLCEVSVYTATGPSTHNCKLSSLQDAELAVLGNTCYSFHYNERKLRWKDAKAKCNMFNNGHLVSQLNDASQDFLRMTLKRLYSPVTLNDVFWVGGHKRSEFQNEGITPIRKWINETTEKYFTWNKHDSNGMGDALESCLTISGPLDWKWTTKHCYTYYPWICEYQLPHCGHPDQQSHTLMDLNTEAGGIHVAQYSCPEGYAVDGTATRTCLPSGLWSDSAPKCKYVNCGHPEGIFNGTVTLVQGTTTYGSAAEYSCLVDGLYLIGPKTRVCQREGVWSGDVPFCSDVLPDPEGLTAVLNLEIVLAIALACLGIVVMVTVITLCIIFFKKRPRRMSSTNEIDSTKNFLAKFDSDTDLGPEPSKNVALLSGYETQNGSHHGTSNGKV